MRCFLPEVRFGSCAFLGRLRFRSVRFVQARLSSSPLRWSVGFGPSASAFLFPCLFRVARSGPGVLVLVFSLSFLLLRSPLGVLVK